MVQHAAPVSASLEELSLKEMFAGKNVRSFDVIASNKIIILNK